MGVNEKLLWKVWAHRWRPPTVCGAGTLLPQLVLSWEPGIEHDSDPLSPSESQLQSCDSDGAEMVKGFTIVWTLHGASSYMSVVL